MEGNWHDRRGIRVSTKRSLAQCACGGKNLKEAKSLLGRAELARAQCSFTGTLAQRGYVDAETGNDHGSGIGQGRTASGHVEEFARVWSD